MPTIKLELINGLKIGRWNVIKEVDYGNFGGKRILCRCECGIERLLYWRALQKGVTKGCNLCRNKRFKLKIGILGPSYRHGLTNTREYRIWSGMLSRCYNKNVRIYKYYGERGIKVCDRWRDFINFYQDMGLRPDNKQLDRIDNTKDYSPDNCRWATAKENNPANKGELPDDMPGKRFTDLLVIERVKHKPNHWYYLCKCDCGATRIVNGGELRRGRAMRCTKVKNRLSDTHRKYLDNIKMPNNEQL